MKNFIDWHNHDAVEKELVKALEGANKHIETGKYGNVDRCLKIASKCIEALSE